MSTATQTATIQPEVDPATIYRQRRDHRAAKGRRLGRINRRITVGRRLLLFAVIGYVVFDPTEAAALIPLGIFLVPLVFVQNAVLAAWRRASHAVSYYERGLARLENRWIGRGPSGARYLTASHIYAEDLDIFGPGSLFQLLCTAQTRMGQDLLARWLSTPDDVTSIHARQDVVRAQVAGLDLREGLASIDANLASIEPAGLIAWCAAPRLLPTIVSQAIGMLLVWGLTIATIVAIAKGPAYLPIVAVLAVLETIFYLLRRPAAVQIAAHVGAAGNALAVLYRVRAELRKNHQLPPAIARTVEDLDRALTMPAGWMAKVYGLTLQNSFLHALKVQGMPLWESWRVRAAPHVARALDAAGEIEALCALSAHAYENPADPFPELVESGPVFDGVNLAHPLMAPGRCVPNDVTLGADRRLILISGSNMSGKSTLLRTVGMNAVLAMAGAPVRATRLKLSPVALGTAMRFRDSVHEGASYFYAVLTRLRAVLDLTGQDRPLLFLLDEILQGTNSQDRLTGAEALMRKLLEAGAIGLMTTHDLALTQIAADLAPRAVNMHCEDQVENGQMTFDYKLRPGVVTKSNALQLMRAMGLDV